MDHIHLSLDRRNQTSSFSDLSRIQLVHEALPELDFSEVDISSTALGLDLKTPFLVSSMTAGHVQGVDLNIRLARVCEARGWLMGVGSQRRELSDPQAVEEWKKVRQAAPGVRLIGNIGLSQLIRISNEDVEQLVESLQASALFVHLNSLQEGLQPEGTPQFKGGRERIAKLSEALSVPVIVKETGCGFSKGTLEKLSGTGIKAVDVSGLGGTHWGRIEGGRSDSESLLGQAAETFADWGIPTVESVLSAVEAKPDYEIWASGGVRSGLDAAKLIALGAEIVGFAQPILAAALDSESRLFELMKRYEYELRLALFCTGSPNLIELKNKKVWKWQTKS